MSLFLVPLHAGGNGRPCQHGLTERQPCQCNGIKGTEGMKRVAFDLCALDSGIEKAKVK